MGLPGKMWHSESLVSDTLPTYDSETLSSLITPLVAMVTTRTVWSDPCSLKSNLGLFSSVDIKIWLWLSNWVTETTHFSLPLYCCSYLSFDNIFSVFSLGLRIMTGEDWHQILRDTMVRGGGMEGWRGEGGCGGKMRVEVEGRRGKGLVRDWRKRERMEVQESKGRDRTLLSLP